MSLFGPPKVEKLLVKKDVKGLIKALGYLKDTIIRMSAAKALGEIGDKQAVEPLIKSLGDKETYVRKAAVISLGMLGDIRAVEPLIQTLKDEKPWSSVSNEAAKVLGNLGDIRAVEPLIKALGDESADVLVVAAAAESLGKLGDRRAVEPLIKALGNKKDYVRVITVESLGKLGDIRTVEPLIKALGDVNVMVVVKAESALEKIADIRDVKPWIKALSDTNTKVRKKAVEFLSKVGDIRAIEPLINTLCDINSDIRKAAANSLEKLGETKWNQIISGDIKSDLQNLTDSLDQRLKDPLVQILLKTLCSADADERKIAADSLEKLGEPKWKELITGNPDSDFQNLADSAEPCFIDPLILLLNNENRSVRMAAANSMIALSSKKPELIGDRWQKVRQIITDHDDKFQHYDGSRNYSDCTHSESGHVDKGIGLKFPDKPENLDF